MTNITPPNGIKIPPQLWKLDENGRPKDSEKFTECIRFLGEAAGQKWIEKHQDQAKQYFALLNKAVQRQLTWHSRDNYDGR